MDCLAKGRAIHLVKPQKAVKKSNVVSNVCDLISILVAGAPSLGEKLKAGHKVPNLRAPYGGSSEPTVWVGGYHVPMPVLKTPFFA